MLGCPTSSAPTIPGTRTQEADRMARTAEFTAISSRTAMPDETARILAKISELIVPNTGISTSVAMANMTGVGTT